jgi:Immunity protein 10
MVSQSKNLDLVKTFKKSLMDKLYFRAEAVENEVLDNEILVVGFYTEENYLMIQFTEEFDEQNIKLGMNTYHIERDDQSYGNYGGVEKVFLKRDQIHFTLTAKGKKNMQCEEVLIDFKIGEVEWVDLKASFLKIFGDSVEVGNT